MAHRSREEVGAWEEALAPGACRDAAVAPASGKGDDQAVVVGILDKAVDEPAEQPRRQVLSVESEPVGVKTATLVARLPLKPPSKPQRLSCQAGPTRAE